MTQSEVFVAPLRVLAVIVSVGVGGYLVWAAQDRREVPAGEEAPPEVGDDVQAEEPELPGEAADQLGEGEVVEAQDELDPILMFSSKSAPIDPEAFEAALKEAEIEVEPQPRFLPSSKVVVTHELMPEPTDRVFLSSSKSAPLHLIDPPPGEKPEAPAKPIEEPAAASGGSRR